MKRTCCAAATARRNGKTAIGAEEAQVARPEVTIGRDAAPCLVDEENVGPMLKYLEIDDFVTSSEEEHLSAILGERRGRR